MPATSVMAKPSRSGRPSDAQGCMITRTPDETSQDAHDLARRDLVHRQEQEANITVAMGVIELPMPANAELIRCSPSANRLNGRPPRKKPVTIRCPHRRGSRGSRPLRR
jgi:hypothetical protein